jgi:proline dehydrogenase
MPGEEIEDALRAAEELKKIRIPTVLTHLGENVTTEEETHQVTQHYLTLLEQIQSCGLDAQISVKLTELGLDQDRELCFKNLTSLITSAADKQNYVWIDMEGSKYTTATLDLYHKAHDQFANTGVCVQSYLYRTAEDLQKLLSIQPGIRLVKGAYAEPPSIAYADRSKNDENYFALATTLLQSLKPQKLKVGFGTHDQALVRRILDLVKQEGVPPDGFEIQMLYGIRRKDQLRLIEQGHRVRVLISYGTFWFPWYMRRLAERPANVLFVAKNIFS